MSTFVLRTPLRQTTAPVLERGPAASTTVEVAQKPAPIVECPEIASDDNQSSVDDMKDDMAEACEEKVEEVDCNIFRKGTVVWFDNCKGYGFIKEDSTEHQYFVHYESITKPNPKWFQVKKGRKVPFKSLKDHEEVQFRLEPETADEMRRKGKRGKKLKPFKAVDVTGPNGRPVQGVRKVDASSSRKQEPLTQEEKSWLAKMPEKQDRSQTESDSASLPDSMRAMESIAYPMPVQNVYQYNQMPSNSSFPMAYTAYPMQNGYPMPALHATPSSGFMGPPALQDCASDASSVNSSGADTNGRGSLAFSQGPLVPAPIGGRWCYDQNGNLCVHPANSPANQA